MPRPKVITTPASATSEVDRLQKRSRALFDLEGSVSDMRAAAEMGVALLEDTMKEARGADFPAIKCFAENGFKVFILTEAQSRVLDYAIYHASEIARKLYTDWETALGGEV